MKDVTALTQPRWVWELCRGMHESGFLDLLPILAANATREAGLAYGAANVKYLYLANIGGCRAMVVESRSASKWPEIVSWLALNADGVPAPFDRVERVLGLLTASKVDDLEVCRLVAMQESYVTKGVTK